MITVEYAAARLAKALGTQAWHDGNRVEVPEQGSLLVSRQSTNASWSGWVGRKEIEKRRLTSRVIAGHCKQPALGCGVYEKEPCTCWCSACAPLHKLPVLHSAYSPVEWETMGCRVLR